VGLLDDIAGKAGSHLKVRIDAFLRNFIPIYNRHQTQTAPQPHLGSSWPLTKPKVDWRVDSSLLLLKFLSFRVCPHLFRLPPRVFLMLAEMTM